MAWSEVNGWGSSAAPEPGTGNLVRNGGLWFAQRQAAGTLTTYSSTQGSRAIAADGWGITNENASAQYVRSGTIDAPEAGLRASHYGQFTKITAAGKLAVSQVVEAVDTAAVRGRAVRLQCSMKQVVGSAPVMRLGLIQLTSAGSFDSIPSTFISAFGSNGTDPTLGSATLARINPRNDSTLDNCTVSGGGASCTLGAAWQRFGAVFDVPSDAKNLIVMLWSNAQFSVTNGFAVSEVSLTDGETINQWMPRSQGEEFARVQRFYHKTFNVPTAPANNIGVNTGEWRFSGPRAGAVASVSPTYLFPVTMRVPPATRIAYNPAAANTQVRDITLAADCTVQAFGGVTERGCYLTYTGPAGSAAGDSMGIHMTFDAEL